MNEDMNIEDLVDDKLIYNDEEDSDITNIDVEDYIEKIACNEELKRIELQDNPTSKASKETKNSQFYKESILIAETIGEVIQKLLGYGVDYNNALSIANNLATGNENIKLAKIQMEQA